MKLENITQKLIDKIHLAALESGWDFKVYDKNTGMISFIREGSERINIYLTKMSVATVVNHPKSGRNQLYRKNLSYNQVVKLLKNPRQHTGKGYRKTNQI